MIIFWVKKYWNQIRKKFDLELSWYQATRHSFVSRLLQAGATLDEVSSAVGHSSPVVTRRYYDHFIRKTYSPQVRSGLGLGGDAVLETAGVAEVREHEAEK